MEPVLFGSPKISNDVEGNSMPERLLTSKCSCPCQCFLVSEFEVGSLRPMAPLLLSRVKTLATSNAVTLRTNP